MSEMVQRMARAMFVADSRRKRQPAPEGEFYAEMAKAAIEAMREPTDGMLDQMQVEVNLSSHPGKYEYLSLDEIKDIWERGLLEALK